METVTFTADKQTIELLINLVNNFKNQNIKIDSSITPKINKRKQQMGILSDYKADPSFYEPLDEDELARW